MKIFVFEHNEQHCKYIILDFVKYANATVSTQRIIYSQQNNNKIVY